MVEETSAFNAYPRPCIDLIVKVFIASDVVWDQVVLVTLLLGFCPPLVIH